MSLSAGSRRACRSPWKLLPKRKSRCRKWSNLHRSCSNPHTRSRPGPPPSKQYQDWIQSLHVLFDTLELWLQPLVLAQVATLRRDTVTITENPSSGELKTYAAPH